MALGESITKNKDRKTYTINNIDMQKRCQESILLHTRNIDMKNVICLILVNIKYLFIQK